MFKVFCLGLRCLAAAISLLSAASYADIPSFPIFVSMDSNDVDLATGKLTFSTTDLTVGSDPKSTLSYTRHFVASGWRNSLMITLSFDSSFSIATVDTKNGGDQLVSFDGGVTYQRSSSTGGFLSKSSSGFYDTYTSTDGTIYTFGDAGYLAQNTSLAYVVTNIKYPDGRLEYYYYDHSGAGASFIRVRSVSNNLGYQIKLEYLSNNTSNIPQWSAVSSVSGYNSGTQYCSPTAACAASTSYPTINYSYFATVPPDGILQLKQVQGPLGRNWNFAYEASLGQAGLSSVQRPDGQIMTIVNQAGTKYGPDPYRQVQSISRAGSTWSYAYQNVGLHWLATATNPLNGQRKYEENQVGSNTIKSVYDELNRKTDYTYIGNLLISIQKPLGDKLSYLYDSRYNVTETRLVSATPGTPADIITTASYPSNCTNPLTCNKPIWMKDERGNQTDYTYDAAHGGVLTITLPPATTGAVRPKTMYGYSAFQAYYKDPSGSIVASGTPIFLQTSVSTCQTSATCAGTADEAKTVIGYGPQTTGLANNLAPISQSMGAGDGSLTAIVTSGFDDAGNRITIDGPLAGTADVTRYRYNIARELVGVISPDPDGSGPMLNRATRMTYDPGGRVTLSERGTTNGQSDSAWLNMTPVDQTGITYDAEGRRTKVTFSSAGTTSRITQYSYDVLDRLECTAIRLNPSAFGSLPSACTVGPLGGFGADRISKNGYDAAGEVTSIWEAYGTADQILDRAITYTANGKILTIKDAKNNLTTNEYDGVDRMLRTRYPSPTSPNISSTTDFVKFDYDAASNIVVTRLRDGTTINSGYDNLNRLTSRSGSTIIGRTLVYDLVGRLTSANLVGGGPGFSATYDALGRMNSSTTSQGMFTFQYDLAGRRTRITWPDSFYVTYDYLLTNEMTAVRESGATSGLAVLATYNYDNLGREVALSRGNGTTTSYGYDGAANLSTLVNDFAGSAADDVRIFSYNPASQIVSMTDTNPRYAYIQSSAGAKTYSANGLNQYTSVGSLIPTYDGRGNTTSLGASIYAYDGNNLLISINGPQSSALSYDVLDRLSQITGMGNTSRFVYDGSNMVGEYTGSNTLRSRYVFGAATDEPLVWYSGLGTSGRRWLHADERGSITAISDSTGNVIAVNRYGDYGQPALTNLGRFQFTGQMWLSEIDLYHYKARTYSPNLGRFLQTDPVGYADTMNLYAYANNDPINAVDSSGRDEDCRKSQGFDSSGTACPPADEADSTIVVSGAKPPPPPADKPVVTRPINIQPERALGTETANIGIVIMDAMKVYQVLEPIVAPLLNSGDPPADAADPNGAKAPGKPGAAEGFQDPKSGPKWGKSPDGRRGWIDNKGNVWVPTGPRGSPNAHGGPHWDVQRPGGKYVNVYPGGRQR